LSKQAPRINLFIKSFREHKVDLVHTHSTLCSAKPEIIAAKICRIPCVLHYHSYRSFNHFDRLFARLVDAFIYISEDVAKFYTSQKRRIFNGTVIHNGVDVSKFTQNYNAASVRKEFGINSEQTLVGIIGRIDWWKGHEYFLKAMSRAIKHIEGLRGLIIGDLEKNFSFNRNRLYLVKLKSLINTMNLDDKILFTGFRNDVPRLISALDVVVHASSKPEPFGLVIIEAMAAGKPVIATAAGGVLDIIEDGVNGLLVPCCDAEAMADAIVQVVSNLKKSKQIGIAAQQCVTEKFTVQQQIMAVEKLYDSIFANNQRY
jgi:glycosyltransferase involved in cell wall biosynthesis